MSALIASVSVSVARGSDKTYAWTHVTSGSDSTPTNITGWTITVTVKNPDQSTVFTKSASVTVGASGTYGWSVTATDTTIDPRTYLLDVWRTDSGAKTLMALGTFTVTNEVRV